MGNKPACMGRYSQLNWSVCLVETVCLRTADKRTSPDKKRVDDKMNVIIMRNSTCKILSSNPPCRQEYQSVSCHWRLEKVSHVTLIFRFLVYIFKDNMKVQIRSYRLDWWGFSQTSDIQLWSFLSWILLLVPLIITQMRKHHLRRLWQLDGLLKRVFLHIRHKWHKNVNVKLQIPFIVFFCCCKVSKQEN